MSGARRSKEQALAEFNWLYTCFEAFVAAHGQVEGIDHASQPAISRKQMFGWLENGHTPWQFVTGVRSALKDSLGTMQYLPRDNPAKGKALNANYLALRGRNLEKVITLAKQATP